METKNISENINKSCETIGGIEMIGIKLESADAKLLDVRDGDFNEHVAIQPAAIAYYGVLKKQAARQLDEARETYKRWEKRKFHEAKIALEEQKTKKSTIADIEAYVIINWEKEIKEIEGKISELQEQYDTFEVWYDAWKQKSWSLKEYGATLHQENFSQNSYMELSGEENVRRLQGKERHED